ncbi:molybdopterin molybdotransferase MoeA [Marinobacter salinisoli]|uniref:Molybdopterin molybdenumtransferase n=1 Tax=Marinobacter salinisoli TaxID=2769486 RepID=A0ABX7MU78_9GAMM|nr:gephyrin-like molybdotransferase Glp [Marinobacter salinisoli]QSP95866.1 molybdopterin molybdotransferase MoeA [Marinobacter salinisoli]
MAAPQLTPLEAAIDHLLAMAGEVMATETVNLTESLHRVLAEDQLVPADVPPADNSSVDGYAVRVEDVRPGQPLPVSDRIPAGQAPRQLAPGSAVRIFTGSEIPPGANAVVMQERVDISDDGITIHADVSEGQNIRRRGQDLSKGSHALLKGTLIRPQEMGLLASIGLAQVPVKRKLNVAILTTGDELVDPGTPLAPGQIYNTNRYTLLGLLEQAGCAVTLCESLADDRATTADTLLRAAGQADLIITSGGVSVGEEDHVRAVLEQSSTLSLWRLAIKPGKPLAFGHVDNTPVLGLPGNPASVLVTFLMVAMPFIRKCQGRPGLEPAGEALPAEFSVHETSVRREFVRVRRVHRSNQCWLETYPNQSSGMLSSACWADGLAVVPENTRVSPGDLLTYYSFNELLA